MDLYIKWTKWKSIQTDEPEGNEYLVLLASSAWELSIFIQLYQEELQHFPICRSDVVWWIWAVFRELNCGKQTMVSHKAKTLFNWSPQYYSRDLDGASIAQKEGSDAIRKQCKVCTCQRKINKYERVICLERREETAVMLYLAT